MSATSTTATPRTTGELTRTLGSDDYCRGRGVRPRPRTDLPHRLDVRLPHRRDPRRAQAGVRHRRRIGDRRPVTSTVRCTRSPTCAVTVAPNCVVRTTSTKGSIRCPYHAWTYGLDGALLATPRVDDEFDRADYGLWPRHADVWNGMVFVSVADESAAARRVDPHREPRSRCCSTISPSASTRSAPASETMSQRTGRSSSRTTRSACTAPSCIPSSPHVIPLYRTGHVIDPDRADGAVDFAPGATAFTLERHHDPRPGCPAYRGCTEYDGVAVFPNMFFDLSPDGPGAHRDVPDRDRVGPWWSASTCPAPTRSPAPTSTGRPRSSSTRSSAAQDCVGLRDGAARGVVEGVHHRRAHGQGPARRRFHRAVPRHAGSSTDRMIGAHRQFGAPEQTGDHVHSTRRQFIVQSAGLGVMLGAGIPLLSACGGDDDDAASEPGDATSAESSAGSSDTATESSPTTSAPADAPSSPTADGLEPEAGPLRIFNYADYVNPDTVAVVRGEVRRQGRDHDVRRRLRSDHEARQRLGRGRRVQLGGAEHASIA